MQHPDKIPSLGIKLGVLIVMMILLLLQPAVGLAGSTSKGLTVSNTLNITGKSNHAVIVLERNFVVSESTSIFDKNGKKIGLDDLAVPCTAEVEYRLRMDQDPLCIAIRVKRLLNGATPSWSSSEHESPN